jgi:phage shock protein A
MGFFSDFFSRGGRVARGQANKAMDNVEDATFEATVRQTVRDMRTELAKTINASAMAMSNHNRLEAEYQKFVRQSEEWFARANQALDAGNEDLAKKALAKKAECDAQVRSMETGVEAARNASEQAERTATTLVARRNAAVAQRKVAEALSGVAEADNAFAALKNFEEGVAREEAKAKAFDQLASGTDVTLEQEFAQLGGATVDNELAMLKAARQQRAIPAAAPKQIASSE